MDLEEFFGSKGPLAKVISNYYPRSSQVEMAQAIDRAIEDKRNLVAEAGTGTGKTFAYLIPAILSGKKIAVSTGTKNLQDQLYGKDIPLIKKAVKIPFRAALLKGRANYLCLHRLNDAIHSGAHFEKSDIADLTKINDWSKTTSQGDINEVAEVAETSSVWYHATSSVDNCLGQDCPVYNDCFVVKARKKAMEAEVLIINHHLLCADWSIRETGFGELLPERDVIIVDEAHQLNDVAENFLGDSLSVRHIANLVNDTLIEFYKEASDMPDLRLACEDLEKEIMQARLAFGVEIRRGEWREIENNPALQKALNDLGLQMKRLNENLKAASVRTQTLEACYKRGQELTKKLSIITRDEPEEWIKWFETHKKSFALIRTPLDIAGEIQKFINQSEATWIFTSATLSVAQNFDHFINSLGLENVSTGLWDSPFDYHKQSLFYHPRGLPLPNTPNYSEAVVETVLPVLSASKGRAFFLFTSHRALQYSAKLLVNKIDYPLLVQGTQSKTRLLESFKQQGNAVLLGTSSFWEGVDVRGEALSCVIIDKLPFASPGDPILKAKLDAMKKQGKNPFYEQQLPVAVISLKQGIGRLIRDIDDRGVLVICDPRLLKRSYGYGQTFLDSFPPMRRTRDIKDVTQFFVEERAQ